MRRTKYIHYRFTLTAISTCAMCVHQEKWKTFTSRLTFKRLWIEKEKENEKRIAFEKFKSKCFAQHKSSEKQQNASFPLGNALRLWFMKIDNLSVLRFQWRYWFIKTSYSTHCIQTIGSTFSAQLCVWCLRRLFELFVVLRYPCIFLGSGFHNCLINLSFSMHILLENHHYLFCISQACYCGEARDNIWFCNWIEHVFFSFGKWDFRAMEIAVCIADRLLAKSILESYIFWLASYFICCLLTFRLADGWLLLNSTRK